jgi:hypothetical protein
MRMIEMMLKFIPFSVRFRIRNHARQAAGLALTVLLILSLVTATQAEEEGDIVADIQFSLEQMSQSVESEV